VFLSGPSITNERLVDFFVTLKTSRYLPSIRRVCDSNAGIDEKKTFEKGRIIGVRIQSKKIRFFGFLPLCGGTNKVDTINVVIMPIQAIATNHL
jgi:hypothetical protein